MIPKLLLYQPRCAFYTMPLGLLAVASAVDRQRVRPIIFDGRLVKDPIKALEPHLDESICLGISVLTGAPIEDALLLCREVKLRRPDLPIVWGGWHPSLFPREVLSEAECVDIVVRGQGEPAMRQLVDRMLDHDFDPNSVAKIPGIAFRENGTPQLSPSRALTPFDELPPADYSLLPVESYFNLKSQRQLDYVTSVGCHYRCRFCADPAVFQRQRTALTPSRVVTELITLAETYGVTDVNFQDETFFNDRRWIREMAEGFVSHEAPFTWAATMRADQGSRIEDDDFRLLVKSGLRKLLIGVEAGSERMLQRLGKDISLEQIETVAARCRKHDIAATFPFIFGIPGEEKADVEASLRLAQELKAMNWKNTTPFFFFKPYPGSDLARDVVKQGFPLPKTLEQWSTFDYVTTASPWVDAQTTQRVRRAAFYSQLGWGRPRWWAAPLQAIARWRCHNKMYGLAIEKLLIEKMQPSKPLV